MTVVVDWNVKPQNQQISEPQHDLHAESSESVLFNTVNFLNIRTPKIFVVITLKVELCGSTIKL